jgi:hypothetical protein
MPTMPADARDAGVAHDAGVARDARDAGDARRCPADDDAPVAVRAG